MLEAIAGSTLDVVTLEAGWSQEDGYAAAKSWLGVALRANRRVDLVGCHNDMIARGVVAAIKEVSADLGQKALARLPAVGCDGTPEGGQALVRSGELAGTVVLPGTSGPAVELLHRATTQGKTPPPLTLLKGSPFPA